jgi:uncharacterized membrane protein
MNGVNIIGLVGLLYLAIALVGAPMKPSGTGWERFVWFIMNLSFVFWGILCASIYATAWKG